jgi:hypothetical protein
MRWLQREDTWIIVPVHVEALEAAITHELLRLPIKLALHVGNRRGLVDGEGPLQVVNIVEGCREFILREVDEPGIRGPAKGG